MKNYYKTCFVGRKNWVSTIVTAITESFSGITKVLALKDSSPHIKTINMSSDITKDMHFCLKK